MNKINYKQLLVAAGLVILGLVLGRILFGGAPESVTHQDHEHQTQAEVWTCSMHPQIRESGPGKCPLCGMDLIPVVTDAEPSPDQIQMTDAALKLAQVETIIVGKSVPKKQVYLPGKVEADERSIAKVTAHFDGRVERLYADFTGQFMNRGQRLATLYSPDLVTAQKELFEALKFKDSNPSFYEAAVQKLKLWELTDGQIQSIIDGGEPQYNFNVYAPRSGTILTREISEGEHVMEGQVLFEIANLNKLWVQFEAFESDLTWIRVGDSIEFQVQSLPGQRFQSVVTFIDPVVNKQTRSASVRTEVVNKDQQLKPEMFVEGIINSGLTAQSESLLVPKTSVLWTGKRAIVYVKVPGIDQPTFEFREIELGTDAGEYYVVNSGLVAGEEIVANGVFKIDGAAQLQGKSSMMNPTKNSTPSTQSVDQKTNPSSSQFNQQVQAVYKAYLTLAGSLVQTDPKAARKHSKSMWEILNDVNANELDSDANQIWIRNQRDMGKSLEIMSATNDVEKIRAQLAPLSDKLYEILQRYEVPTGGYRMYCPMAFDYKGAYWLSDSREVLNPYFGDQMLNCGSVEEVLDN